MLQPLVLTIPWGVAWYISPATYDSRLFLCFRVADLTKKHHPFVRIHGRKLVLHLTRLNKVSSYKQNGNRAGLQRVLGGG